MFLRRDITGVVSISQVKPDIRALQFTKVGLPSMSNNLWCCRLKYIIQGITDLTFWNCLAPMNDTSKNIVFCRDMVQQDDRARYETVLFAPRKQQAGLWALYAFNQEVAKTRESVSEPALGEIRLQWWHDVIGELRQGTVREHPVAAALAAAKPSDAVLSLLEGLIDARGQDLYDEGPADQAALEGYANSVGGALCEAALRLCMTEEPAPEMIDTVRRSGSAWAMLGLVRAIPFHWASNRNYVPGDKGLASLATTDADKMYALAKDAIDGMIGYAVAHSAWAKASAVRFPADYRHILLLNAHLELHIKALAAAGNNPFKAREPSTLRRLVKLMTATVSGR